MDSTKLIKPRIRETIIQSLRSGVVPRVGLQYVQVGREKELQSFIGDINNIYEGGTSFRFLIGEYGSGKTFFASLVRSIALEKNLVTMHADLSPNKRFCGSEGYARRLFSELVSSTSTRTKQDGNALSIVLDKFITNVDQKSEGNVTGEIIMKELGELTGYTAGFSFASAVAKYWEGYHSGNETLKKNALKWLCAEYSAKTDSNRELHIREIISDASFFDSLKLYSVLVRKAGYNGLFICFDEMVNLYKIANSISRKANYEQILYMLNNTIQGSAQGIGFLLCGTPEFLTDSQRGLYSYEALKSRLYENKFAMGLGINDYSSIVLRLGSLTKEELYVLLKNLRNIYAYGDNSKYLVPDEALTAFMQYCSDKIGDSYFQTPRETIRSFLDFLSILDHNPEYKWTDLIKKIDIHKDTEQSDLGKDLGSVMGLNANEDNEFANFRI